jgi:hypothetical protein
MSVEWPKMLADRGIYINSAAPHVGYIHTVDRVRDCPDSARIEKYNGPMYIWSGLSLELVTQRIKQYVAVSCSRRLLLFGGRTRRLFKEIHQIFLSAGAANVDIGGF